MEEGRKIDYGAALDTALNRPPKLHKLKGPFGMT